MTTFSRRRPGKVVQCQDGRVGRTYNDEPLVNGKVRVHLFPDSVRLAMDAAKAKARGIMTQAKQEITKAPTCPHNCSSGARREGLCDCENFPPEPERRLCDHTTLKIIGYAD